MVKEAPMASLLRGLAAKDAEIRQLTDRLDALEAQAAAADQVASEEKVRRQAENKIRQLRHEGDVPW